MKHVTNTDGKWKLAHALQEKMTTLGLTDITLSNHGCLIATLPSNVSWSVPVIGFISHMDTAPDFTGKM